MGGWNGGGRATCYDISGVVWTDLAGVWQFLNEVRDQAERVMSDSIQSIACLCAADQGGARQKVGMLEVS